MGLEATALIQARDDFGLDQDGSSGGGKKCPILDLSGK